MAAPSAGRDLGRPLLTGNLIFPCGTARRVKGGYRLSGRRPFGSGIDHACANFFAAMVEGADPPEFRILLVPKGDYTVLDTWHASGLRGIGSNDATVDDVFVPEYRTVDAAEMRHGAAPSNAVNTGPFYRLPLFAMFFTWVGATVLGMAELGTIYVKVAEARTAVATARRIYLGSCAEATAIAEGGALPDAETRAATGPRAPMPPSSAARRST